MRILFAGTSDIGEKTLETLASEHTLVGVITQPDRPAGRHRQLQAPAIKQLLQKRFPATPLLQPEQLRDPAVLAWVQTLQPEVMVTMSYGKIVPREILELPDMLCLNVHASLLPRHRGASPIQTAIMEGAQESGITIMYMAEGLDTGDILLSKKISLAPRETAGSLTTRLANLAPEALSEALLLLQQGKAPRIPQSEDAITLTQRIERSDALLDWTRSATELERLIRGLNPKPGAHGTVQLPSGKSLSLKIFSATVRSHETASVSPGSFFLSQHQELLLGCGTGALLLEEVQPEGRSRMSFAAFARGHQK